MFKLIIWIPGRPTMNGLKRRAFLWSTAHRCYVYEGAEIDPADFNAKYEKAVKNIPNVKPGVRVIVVDAGLGAAPETLDLAPEKTADLVPA